MSKSVEVALRRACGFIVWEINNCNPNGDPDWEGMPRRFVNGHGWISDVAMKRRCRDVLEDHSSPLFIELAEMLHLTPDEFHVLESHYRGFDPGDAVSALKEAVALGRKDSTAFLKRYWDTRVFGTTFLTEGGEVKNTSFRFKRTGPVTVTLAESVAPVQVIETTCGKKAPLEEEKLAAGNGTLAPASLKFVQHGIYAQRIGVCPQVAHYTGTTTKDIEVFQKAMLLSAGNSVSRSRPQGSMNILHFFWAEHDRISGSFDERKFYRGLMPVKKVNPGEPSFDTNEYEFPNSVEGIKVVDLVKM